MPANIMRMPLSTPLKSTSTSHDISATLRSSSGAISQAEPASDCLASPLRPGVKQAFTFGCNAGRTGGRIACPHGKSKRRRSIAARSRVSGRHCPQFSQPACLAGRLPGHSFRRRRGSPSTPSGAPIRCARIVSRVRWRREAASRTDGRGNSARRRAECPRHFVFRPRPIEKRPLHAARLLLRVRTARLSLRMACRPVGQRPEQARHLAWCMRHRLAVLECAKPALRGSDCD